MKDQSGSTGILYSFFNLSARWDWCSMPHPVHFTPGRETWYPFYRRMGEPHSGCRKSQSPDYPACSRSLYQPHCPGPLSKTTFVSYFACNCSYRLSPVHWCFISYAGGFKNNVVNIVSLCVNGSHLNTFPPANMDVHADCSLHLYHTVKLRYKQKEITNDWIYDGSCMPVTIPVLNLENFRHLAFVAQCTTNIPVIFFQIKVAFGQQISFILLIMIYKILHERARII